MLKEPPEEEAPKEEEEEDMPQSRIMTEVAGIVLGLDIPKDIKKPIELVKGLLELPWSNLDPSSINNNALAEKEILIPTASKLCDGGVKFSFTDHITAIGFETVAQPYLSSLTLK